MLVIVEAPTVAQLAHENSWKPTHGKADLAGGCLKKTHSQRNMPEPTMPLEQTRNPNISACGYIGVVLNGRRPESGHKR